MEGYEEGEAILFTDKEHRKEAVDLILKNLLNILLLLYRLHGREYL